MSRPTIPFSHLLLGVAPLLPPYTASRVHRCQDDPLELQEMPASEVARIAGITRQAACLRIQKAKTTGDWSSLLAPPTTTPAAQSASTAHGPERHGAMSTDTMTTTSAGASGKGKRSDFELGVANGRKQAGQILSYAIKRGQANAGLVHLRHGMTVEQSAKAIDAIAADRDNPIGRDEATQAWAQQNLAEAPPADPKAVAQRILESARKAGY